MLGLFKPRTRQKNHAMAAKSPAMIEGLESRTLLSAAVEATLKPNLSILASSTTTSTDVQGYTPAQMAKAYGFDQISLPGGVTADGKGQTIAIIDAYNDPNINADLKVFDSQFDLADPTSFKIVNQTGGSKLPTTDSGWAGEISLDVEWAHAMAPGANILLVETNSSSVDDLMAGVKYARSQSGVSAVSMSWGGSEFFSWGFGNNSGESQSQTNFDPFFTTPAGHQGITFVASAGDSGTFSGVEWPASSPNVLSVGGTTLNLQSDGTYVSESGWSGTSGGYSQVESEPSWQYGVQNSGARSSPDVAYDADPNTGVPVYDSLPDQGYSGWQEVGGTSAGAPQWAALIAIADQARALQGQTTLDGATQTMSMLYNLYSAPDSADYSTYTSYFNDVSSSDGGRVRWRWGFGGFGDQGSATSGYDIITGLGSPHANEIVDALSGLSTSSGSTGSTGSSGSNGNGSNGSTSNGGATSTPQQLPASPLTAIVVAQSNDNAMEGSSGWIKLRIINTGAGLYQGPTTIDLYASSDSSYSSDDIYITTQDQARLTLRAGASKVIRIKYDYPTGLSSGDYYVIASVNAVGTDTAAAQAATNLPITLSPATVDLAASFPQSSVAVTPGSNATATVTISNEGNVTAVGTLSLNLYASNDQTLDSSDQLLTTLPSVKIRLKPGKSITLHVRFGAPSDRPAGNYDLIASITSATQIADSNSSNDTAVIATSIA